MLNKKLFICIILFSCILSAKLNAQDNMAPPKPLDNKVYEAMTGSWTSDDKMMGMAMHQDVNIRWALNHQYIIMDMKAVGKDKPNIKYNGMGIFGIDDKGNAKTWWFDDWGAGAMSAGSGTFGNNLLTMTDENAMFNETRTFDIKGNQLIMHAKGTMKINGQDVPFEEINTYTKK